MKILNPKHITIFCTLLFLIISNSCEKSATGNGNNNSSGSEIIIKAGNTSIASETGTYDFSDVNVSEASTDISFTIENGGEEMLLLTSNPAVAVTGNDANMFSITQQPTNSIEKGASSDFKINFSPSSSGNKMASISISNNDKNNDPFTFSLTGNGAEPTYTSIEIAEKFISLVNIATTSNVTLVGPVEPGTKIIEQNLGDREAIETILPNASGTYYAFIIDNEPNMMFEHDMDYAWIDMDTETVGGTTDVLWPGLIIRPDVTPSPFTILDTFDVGGVSFTRASGEGLFEGEDNSQKNTPETLGKLSLNTYGIERAPRKLAFVIDAGERSGNDRLHDLHTSPMASWVEGEGFQVIHTSQDASNTLPRWTSPNNLTSNITAAGTYFANLGEPECGCDEFFLYITGHGTQGGHSGIGLVNGNASNLIKYQDVYDAISASFPSYVKVTLFFDSCFSGRSISVFPNTLNSLCSNLCAVTVLASCKSTVSTGAPVYGSGVVISGTQMFAAGANLDHDRDGKIGDLKDRFTEMQGRQTTLESKSFHCPEGGSWCSLDAPPPPEETAQCTGVTHGSSSSVIKVCIKYCNVPEGATVDIALSGPSPGSATVDVIDGEACVEFPINWYGDYTWTAALNPGGVPSTGSITVTAADVPCTY